jgi:polysaccharide deacetylase 2 family uncharacterized protein YibQ
MSAVVRKYLILAQKLCAVLLVAWCVVALVFLWRSGSEETKTAVEEGRRFVIHIKDGKVEGKAQASEEAADPKQEIAKIIPPVNEPAPADASAVTEAIKPSATPIADPSDELLDKSAGVSLPRISPSGLKPWQYYVKTYNRPDQSPMVALIITGLGQSKNATEMALRMDERIGLSFSPYSAAVGSWAAASRISGHEMYVDLPTQTAGYPNDDPGPYSVLITRSNTENIKNLFWAMSRFQGYVGLMTPIDEVITASADTFQPIAKEIAHRGALLVVGHPLTQQIDEEDEKKENTGLLQLNADVWIDEELTEMSMQARLATLEQIAQRNGSAIGVAQAYPMSLKQIQQWQQTLKERGVELVPLSFLAKLK